MAVDLSLPPPRFFPSPGQSGSPTLAEYQAADMPLAETPYEAASVVPAEQTPQWSLFATDVSVAPDIQPIELDMNPQPDTSRRLFQDPAEQAVLFYQERFACPVKDCSKVFSASRSYRSHRVKYHGLPRFTCIVCLKPFASYSCLTEHMEKLNHHIQCIMCSQDFKRLSEAQSHFGLKHRLYRCLHCAVPIHGKLHHKNHVSIFHSAEESALFAPSYVETDMNASFHGSVSDQDYVEVPSVHANGSGTSDCPIEVEDDPIIEMDDDSPIEVESDSTPIPDSTTFSENHVMVPYTNQSSNLGSDSVTAGIELPSSTDTDPLVSTSNETEDCETSSFLIATNVSENNEVFFGPGATDLFEDSSDTFAFSNNKEDNSMVWIGHNVDMYQSLSEKRKKIFRYICRKCSHSFKSKDMLKKHAKIHEHVCKYCFLQFDSLMDYKSHVKKHHSAYQYFLCTVCSHRLHGLKSLMVHEMRHRLNTAFKRKVEETTHICIGPIKESDYFKCVECEELVQGFSHWVRHEVWHKWSYMWTSYVAGRIFTGIFEEEDSLKFKNAVETELIMKWRDCPSKYKHANNSLDSKQSHETLTGQPDDANDLRDNLPEDANDLRDNLLEDANDLRDNLPEDANDLRDNLPEDEDASDINEPTLNANSIDDNESTLDESGIDNSESSLNARGINNKESSMDASGIDENEFTLDARGINDKEHSLDASYISDNESTLDASDVNDNDSTFDETEADSEDESEVESEISEEGISAAVNGWMSYWSSYLGLDDAPPSWVKPILKKLRFQWKSYADEHHEMYRQMDQIGVLIRAQQNETSPLDGPRVILEKLPLSLFVGNKKDCHLTMPNCTRSVGKTGCHKKTRSSNLSGKCRNGTSKSLNNVRKYTQSAQPSARQSGDSPRLSACPKPVEQIQISPGSSKLFESANQVETSNANSQMFLKKIARSAQAAFQKPNSPVGAKPTELGKKKVPTLPLSSKIMKTNEDQHVLEYHLLFKRPLVVLEKLDSTSLTLKSGNKAEVIPKTPLTSPVSTKHYGCASPSSPACSLSQMIEWTRKEIGDQPIPMWAMPLIGKVSEETKLSAHDKVDKLRQIVYLIKAKCAENSNTQLMPVVKLVNLGLG